MKEKRRTKSEIGWASFLFAFSLLLFTSGARADWELDGSVLSDPDTGWKFTTTSCTYGDVTGLAITGVKQSSSTTEMPRIAVMSVSPYQR